MQKHNLSFGSLTKIDGGAKTKIKTQMTDVFWSADKVTCEGAVAFWVWQTKMINFYNLQSVPFKEIWQFSFQIQLEEVSAEDLGANLLKDDGDL